MAAWFTRVKIKHLLTESEDPKAVRASMSAIADILDANPVFATFRWKKKFRHIPDGDDVVSPTDYANTLLNRLYDYADEKRIWIA